MRLDTDQNLIYSKGIDALEPYCNPVTQICGFWVRNALDPYPARARLRYLVVKKTRPTSDAGMATHGNLRSQAGL